MAVALARSRVAPALERRHNWIQLAQFCTVGAVVLSEARGALPRDLT